LKKIILTISALTIVSLSHGEERKCSIEILHVKNPFYEFSYPQKFIGTIVKNPKLLTYTSKCWDGRIIDETFPDSQSAYNAILKNCFKKVSKVVVK